MSAPDPTITTTTSPSVPSSTADSNPATAAHPPHSAPNPTVTTTNTTNAAQQESSNTGHNAAQGGLAPAHAPGAAELARLKVNLRNGLRQFPDFPSPGILFEDIMPLFASHALHSELITALELQITEVFGGRTETSNKSSNNDNKIDVIVGLESRGFLFGPTLALKLGAGFVPVRKRGKLPGECVTEGFKKEYGEDFFQMQKDGIKPGQNVVVVDDIIATGGSAAAAGNLVRKLGGKLLGYVFLMELDFLKGREKLDAPVYTLLSGQEEALQQS